MTTEPPALNPVLNSILHPSDFTQASELAFAHALKAALVARADLALLHVAADPEDTHWTDFPGVRQTLERWGLLPAGSGRGAVAELGIGVKKVIARHQNPVNAVLGYLDDHEVDLIVLATHHHGGINDWLHRSISEPVARKSGQMTLFIPAGSSGFVSLADGSVSLRRILIPVAGRPRPQPAVTGAARLVRQLNCAAGVFTLLHVGDDGGMPALDAPDIPGWSWDRVCATGEVVDVIEATARQTGADLIVMSTAGHHGFLDALRGSHSERVLRSAPCPLLAIPPSSRAAEAMN